MSLKRKNACLGAQATRSRVIRTTTTESLTVHLLTGLQTIWSQPSYRSLDTIARTSGLDIAHFHNTFPLVSPSAYYAVRRHHVPVIQTLHNYRLLCPGATFYRNGKVCEECLNGSLAPALRHGCYRNSRAATAAVAAMLVGHRGFGTWQRMVDVYIALSEFARRKYIEGGLPGDRIVVKPNFIDVDPGSGRTDGDHALFVGRVSEEKGVRTLLDAWGRLAQYTTSGDRARADGRPPTVLRHRVDGIAASRSGYRPDEGGKSSCRAINLLRVSAHGDCGSVRHWASSHCKQSWSDGGHDPPPGDWPPLPPWRRRRPCHQSPLGL